MAVDFKSLLSKPVDAVEKPRPLPAGTYFGKIAKYEFLEAKNEKKTPYMRAHLALHSAADDVSSDDLRGIDITKKTLRRDFYLTDDALYRLKELIESCKIPTGGRTLSETIPDLLNAQVMVSVTQRSSQTGDEIYNDVSSVVGA